MADTNGNSDHPRAPKRDKRSKHLRSEKAAEARSFLKRIKSLEGDVAAHKRNNAQIEDENKQLKQQIHDMEKELANTKEEAKKDQDRLWKNCKARSRLIDTLQEEVDVLESLYKES